MRVFIPYTVIVSLNSDPCLCPTKMLTIAPFGISFSILYSLATRTLTLIQYFACFLRCNTLVAVTSNALLV